MKKHPKLKSTVLAATLALLSLGAQADLARRGPISNVNGYPLWYQDLNGLALDLCLPNASDPGGLQGATCLMEGPPPYTFPANFPGESFYFRGTVDMPLQGGQRAVLVLAHEAAFTTENATPGQQMVFTRIRVVMGAPEDGTYVITHPYGTETQDVVGATGARDITITDDVGTTVGAFEQSLTSRFGPYLVAADAAGNPLPPVTINGAQFLADAAVPTNVTGSPFGTNFFMVCGTRPDGTAIPLGTGGPTGACAVATQFALTGRLHDMVASPIGSPLSITAANYSRDAAGTHVKVHAQVGRALPVQPVPSLTAASLHTPPVAMVGPDVLDRFFTQGFTDPSGDLPGQITVTNSGDNPPTSVVEVARDIVTIASVNYNATAQTLTVVATTSDKGFGTQPAPALSMPGFANVTVTPGGIAGDPASVTLVATGVAVAPAEVGVQSAAGGIAKASTDTDPDLANGPGVPFTLPDVASVQAGAAAITIPVLTNDLANAAAPINPATVTILAPGVTPAGLGTAAVQPDGSILFTPGAGVGTASFKYTVRSSNPAVAGASNVSEVVVNLTEPAGGFLPIATADSVATIRSRSFAYNVLANDSGNGGTLDPASVQIVAGSVTGGTATVNANGTVQFVSGTTLGNAFGFDYTVANTNGNRSAPVRATVRVVNEALTFNTVAPECRISTRRWRAAGTGATPGTTMTWYSTAAVPATPSAANTIGTATVAANGTFAFDVTSPIACTTRATFRTEAGTTAANVAVRQR